jgi:hypothetical protein
VVAAVADKTVEDNGQESHVDLSHLIHNPVLWMLIRNGGVLSCSILRSNAVRAAGLFVPGMHVSEDTDFLIRLFFLGGAARSASRPVRQIRAAPLEPRSRPISATLIKICRIYLHAIESRFY